MVKKIFALFIIIVSFFEAGASHLLGGIMTYKYIGRTGSNASQAIYQINITVYRDCSNSSTQFDDPLELGVYNMNKTLIETIEMPLIQQKKVNPPNGGFNCNFNTNFCIYEGIYIEQIVVDAYQPVHLWYQRCCRNVQNNIIDATGQSYYVYIPPTVQYADNSPIINGVPAPYLCKGDTVTFSNAATDADGDSLVYSLENPWTGGSTAAKPPPPNTIPLPLPIAGYKNGYSYANPFGIGGILTINSQTGLTTLLAPITGQFSFAIVVKEYRKINGVWVYLSEIRRDLQLISTNCTPNKKPIISVTGIPDAKGGYNYSVESGEKICFDITYSDPDYNSNPNGQSQMSMSFTGDILKGTNGYTGPLATITKKLSVPATIIHEFCWQTSCIPKSLVQSYPYSFNVTVSDSGCPPKSVSTDFNIYVTPYVSNPIITGERFPCEKRNYIYTASSPKGVKYNWTITGPGTIISGQGTNTLIVRWNSAGSGSVVVNDTTAQGCAGFFATIPIKINGIPNINYSIKGDTLACENSVSNYQLSFTPTSTFNWLITGGTQLTGGTTGAITVKWGAPGNGSIRLIELSNFGCGSDTILMNVRIVKAAIDTIMGPRSVCPNITFVDYKTTYIKDATYQWFVTGGYQSSGSNFNQITINWGSVGVGKIKVVATSKEGCVSDTIYASVIINHVIQGFTPLGDSVVCEFEQNKTYEVVYTRRSLYTWFVTGGTNLNPGTTQPKISINWGSAGIGTVTCIETSFDSIDNLPCNGLPATLKVRIPPIPVSDKIIGDKFVCQSGGSASYTINGYPGSTYIWWLDNNVNNINGQGSNTVTFNWNIFGIYKLSVQEISKDSCIGNRIDTFITVRPKPTTSTIKGNPIVCFPNHTSKTYSVQGNSNSIFYWNISNGTIVSGGNTNSIIVDWDDNQNCQLSVVEQSEFGCMGDTQNLNVFVDHPSIVIKSVGDEYVNEKNIILQWQLLNAPRYNSNFEIWRRVAFSNNPFTYIDSISKTDSVFIHKFQNTTTTAYEYDVRIKNLCGTIITAPFHRNILLIGKKANNDNYAAELNWNNYFGWDGVGTYELYRRVGEDGEYQIYDNLSDTAITYKNGFDSYYQCYRLKAVEQVNGNNQISWSNEICLGFDPIIWIPNAFTPDGNGLNDLYEIFTASIKEFHIQIYDRWGEKVFESSDPKMSWDGNFKEQTSAMDTYVYMIQYKGFDNKRIIKNGTFMLLR